MIVIVDCEGISNIRRYYNRDNDIMMTILITPNPKPNYNPKVMI